MTIPTGIPNQGNSCFSSSVLQLLRAVNIKIELANIVQHLHDKFNARLQEDAHEWLLHVLDYIYPKPTSPLDGNLEVVLTYDTCGHSSRHTEPFRIPTISMGVPVLDHFHEVCSVDNVICDQCPDTSTSKKNHSAARQCAQKITKVCTYPRILVLHINRFRGLDKSQQPVLGLLPQLTVPFRGDPSQTTTYQLSGFVCHLGRSKHHGHYVAYVLDTSTDRWYLCNDDHISTVDQDQILQVLPTAYILAYQHRWSQIHTSRKK